jgi:hypothetical protein
MSPMASSPSGLGQQARMELFLKLSIGTGGVIRRPSPAMSWPSGGGRRQWWRLGVARGGGRVLLPRQSVD